MKNNIFGKGLILVIIVLFFGSSFMPIGSSSSIENYVLTKELISKSNSYNDTIPPVTTMEPYPPCPDGPNGWYVSDVTITLEATDDISGVNATYYRINEGEWNIYVEPLKLENDGYYSFEFYSVDNAGNEEPKKGPFFFKIDQTPPEIQFYYKYFRKQFQWYIKFIAIANDTMSGMDKVEFYADNHLVDLDMEEPYEFTFLYSEIFGYLDLKVVAYDKAGNTNYDDDPRPVSYPISQSYSSQQLNSQQINQLLQNLILHHQMTNR